MEAERCLTNMSSQVNFIHINFYIYILQINELIFVVALMLHHTACDR